jgi:ubiquinone/menaquinone biosynthesis C-methylase UbiE
VIDDAKTRAAATYNAAADYFDAPALRFWDRLGRRTVERISLQSGAAVLDACCGAGASAIPAAEAVGPNGRVLGVDLAENLLTLARSKAARQGLSQAEFRFADIEALDPSAEMFDVAICVFGIFFLPDIPAGVRCLWRLLRPGGQLVITTWGPRFGEPGSSAFWNAVRRERPELYKGFNPWDRICDPDALAAVFREAGVEAVDAQAESSVQPLESPKDFWTIVLGSGYRATVEQLNADERERVRAATISALVEHDVRSVETNAVFALARKRTGP